MKNKIFIVLALFLLGCSNKHEDIHIKILGTSDIHGALSSFDLIQQKPARTSLAQIYSYVDSLRRQPNLEVVLLDNGDILQGTPLVYYSNFEAPHSKHICAEVMNFMGYDAATLGNHDIEAGHTIYDKLNKDFKFPWLAANIINTQTNLPYFKPYTIINRKHIKIAVIGLITPAIPLWLPEKMWEGMRFDAMLPTAKKWLKIVKEKEKPDLIIGVFHSGVGEETSKNKEIIENASKLVLKETSGFDLIICGHDHRKGCEVITDASNYGVILLNPQNNASYLASVGVDFRWNESTNSYDKYLVPKLIDVSQLPVSENYVKHFQQQFKTVEKYVSKKVGVVTRSFSAKPALWGDSPFMDLIHGVQLNITKADISFAAPLSLSASINSGDLYVSDLFKLYAYENLIYTLKLSGKEIKDYLEFSYKKWYQQMYNASDNLLFIEQSDNDYHLTTPIFNYDSAEGIVYSVDVSKPYGKRITIDKMSNGKPFCLDSIYTVAMNSYRGNGGGELLTQGAGLTSSEIQNRIIASTSNDFRFYLKEWIQRKKILTPSCNHNWQVIPKQWLIQAQKRELKLLRLK